MNTQQFSYYLVGFIQRAFEIESEVLNLTPNNPKIYLELGVFQVVKIIYFITIIIYHIL